MVNDKISVIIPTYNSESYICECLDSILSQIHRNIEVIVVDDGSSDRTVDILKKYASKDDRIKIITQENRGVSSARNKGMETAKGNWISFVDSDDSIAEDSLQLLLEAAVVDEADVVIGEYSELSDEHIRGKFLETETKVVFDNIDKESLYKSCIDPHGFGRINTITNIGVPWGKLYRSELIKKTNVTFNSRLNNMEDMLFNLYIFSVAKRIVYMPENIYHYRITAGSLVSRPDFNYVNQARIIVKELEKFAQDNNELCTLEKVIDYKRFCLFYECIKKGPGNPNCLLSRKEKKSMMKDIVSEKTLDGRFRRNILDWMSKPQIVYSFLSSIKMYNVLLILIEISMKIKIKKGILR